MELLEAERDGDKRNKMKKKYKQAYQRLYHKKRREMGWDGKDRRRAERVTSAALKVELPKVLTLEVVQRDDVKRVMLAMEEGLKETETWKRFEHDHLHVWGIDAQKAARKKKHRADWEDLVVVRILPFAWYPELALVHENCAIVPVRDLKKWEEDANARLGCPQISGLSRHVIGEGLKRLAKAVAEVRKNN
jgi:hypothetical protein